MSGPETIHPATANLRFGRWIEEFRSRAIAQGISPETFAAAFRGVEYNTGVIEKDRNQSEFTKAIWDYLDSAVSDIRVANGRAALDSHRQILDRIEAEFGDVLFALVNLARHRGVDLERALRRTCDKFQSRFAHVEESVRASHGDWPRDERGKPTSGLALSELDGYWDEAKARGGEKDQGT